MPRSFPMYILETDQCESPITDLTWDESDHVIYLAAIDQFLGFNSAMLYLNREIIDQPQRKFTANSILEIIKQLQKLVVESLLVLDREGALGGNFYDEGGTILLNSSSKDNAFEQPINDANILHNAKVLRKKDSPEAAQQYLDYHNPIISYYKSQLRRIGSDPKQTYFLWKKSALDITHELGLDQHPGFIIHKKIVRILDKPDQVIRQVVAWAQKFAGSLNRQPQEDPYTLAAQALQLSAIHPFKNGNGRTGRLLANAILLSRGYSAINFNSIKAEYYEAISQSETSIQPLVDLLKKVSTLIPADQDDQPTVHEVSQTQPLLVHKWAVYVYPGGYHIVDKANRRAYEANNRSPLNTIAIADAKSCKKKAQSFSDEKPNVAIFYWYQAARFLIEEGQVEQACQCYLAAAKLCIKEEFFDGAYDLLCRCKLFAEQSQLQSIKNEIVSLLGEINFVSEYRERLVNIEKQELAKCGDAHSSAQLITQFSSILQVDTSQAASSSAEKTESTSRVIRP